MSRNSEARHVKSGTNGMRF